MERAASAAAKVPMPTLQPWLGRETCRGTKCSFPLWLAESSYLPGSRTVLSFGAISKDWTTKNRDLLA